MKLSEFLLKRTAAHELCVIRESGYVVATFWIDYEDLFARHMDNSLGDKEVKYNEWDFLPIVKENGQTMNIPCHYIDI